MLELIYGWVITIMAWGAMLLFLLSAHAQRAERKARQIEREIDKAHTAMWDFNYIRHGSKVRWFLKQIHNGTVYGPRMRSVQRRALFFMKPKLGFYERKLLGQVWSVRSEYHMKYRHRRHPHRHDRAMHRYLARELRKIWG